MVQLFRLHLYLRLLRIFVSPQGVQIVNVLFYSSPQKRNDNLRAGMPGFVCRVEAELDHLFQNAVREPLSSIVIANSSTDIAVSYTFRIGFHEFKYMGSEEIRSDQRFDLSDGLGHSTVN